MISRIVCQSPPMSKAELLERTRSTPSQTNAVWPSGVFLNSTRTSARAVGVSRCSRSCRMGTIGQFSHPNAIATPRMVQIHSAVQRGDGARRQSTASAATAVARLSLPANRPRRRHCSTMDSTSARAREKGISHSRESSDARFSLVCRIPIKSQR